jgi:hypothetical protein
MAEKLENADERRGKEATFPAQALSCSGSTGIISALSSHQWRARFSTPGTLLSRFSAGNTNIRNRLVFDYIKLKISHATFFGFACLSIIYLKIKT